jgi:choline dehydrogenase
MASREESYSARVRANQRALTAEIGTKFDYIVCGAGTSGSVVAARLAANPNVRVLLLEAGGSDEADVIADPNRWPMTLGSELDWGFVAEPNPHLNGRAIPYSMGKVLGGGSSINVSTWSRGHQADWDLCAAESGDASWGYEAVLDLYRNRIEAWTGKRRPGLSRQGWSGARTALGRASCVFLRVARRRRVSRPAALSECERPNDGVDGWVRVCR